MISRPETRVVPSDTKSTPVWSTFFRRVRKIVESNSSCLREATQLQMNGFLWNDVFKDFSKTCWEN
jgi:hypothetical protein